MLKIIFMGTGDFAVQILHAIVEQKRLNVVAIYTKNHEIDFAKFSMHHHNIYTIAKEFRINVKTPTTLAQESCISELRNFHADIIVVASYGMILSRQILDIPRYGCINVHPSALPRWRGAAPIQRALMEGDSYISVCIVEMNEGLDTGPIIMRKSIKIDDDIDCGNLTKICADLGGNMLTTTLLNLECGIHYDVTEQDDEGVTYANKIEKYEEQIDWTQSASKVINRIRALSPTPGAYFTYRNIRIKILQAIRLTYIDEENQCGTVIIRTIKKTNEKEVIILCGDGRYIKPIIIQKEGSKVMKMDDFLRGNYSFFEEQ